MADSLTALFLQKKRKVDVIGVDVMMRDVRRWEKDRDRERLDTLITEEYN